MGEKLKEGFISAAMRLPLPVTGTTSRRAEDFLGSDGVVPLACSGSHLHLPPRDEAEPLRPEDFIPVT